MERITSENYVEKAVRTENKDTEGIVQRISDPTVLRLLHSAMGLATEAGEIVDQLKKHIFYGKELDLLNLKEEYGDNMWYVALGIDALREDLGNIMTGNIAKLAKRYPNFFTKEDAINRDTAAEINDLQEAMEGKS